MEKDIRSINLNIGKLSYRLDKCDLIGMMKDISRIVDNSRAMKDDNIISSNEYLGIIDRIDNVVGDANINCKCTHKSR